MKELFKHYGKKENRSLNLFKLQRARVGMNIQLVFLGTSNAVPTAERNHPAIWLEWGSEKILIDCGEGTQRQIKKASLNPCKLTKILLTHLHGDHVLGLPGLLETLEMSEYARQLNIYGPKGTARHVMLLQQIYGQFNINIKVHELPTQIESDDWEICSAPMDHGIPTWAFKFILKEKRRLDKAKIKKLKLPNSPILGELQKGNDIILNGKKIKAKDITYVQPSTSVAFIMDTKMNEKAIELARNTDLLVCEATYSEREKDYAENYKHLTASQAATIAKKAKAKRLVLTHIAQRYEHDLKTIESEAKKVFKNTKAVKDLERTEIKSND